MQATPHAPQLVALESDASQPLAVAPSQSANPAAQAVSVHVPVAQDSLASASAHRTPHEPQLISDVSDVSQPSSGSPLQSP